ncbi:hypothetical protein [Microbacterium oxydans]|uniref:hypothetical protein n=1 Tax=Microbacterium oxydans TaxID=82380 RepID=UPI0024AE3DDC|nr:hypothetical protein [Microbacterium oxydans]
MTDDQRTRIADEISGIQVGSGFYSTSIGSDAALEVADALIAAGVVTEDPEWEYGYELVESDTRDVLTRSGAFESFEAAQHWAQKAHKDESDPEYPPLDVLIVRRRKAGPWVPVKQEGAET